MIDEDLIILYLLLSSLSIYKFQWKGWLIYYRIGVERERDFNIQKFKWSNESIDLMNSENWKRKKREYKRINI